MPTVKPMIQDGFDYREMTDAEFAQYELDQIEAQKYVDFLEQNKQLRNSALAKLAALGLTEGEVAAIFA